MFDLKEDFFRGSLVKDDTYKGYGFFKYKGRFLDPDVIYDLFNYQAYDWKNYFLYNFVFGFFRDNLLELRIKGLFCFLIFL